MLVELRVANHRSIREEVALTFSVGRGGTADDPRPRVVDGWGEALLPVAALYGANASGKSNLLSALAFVVEAVERSHRAWPVGGGVPRDPFAWGDPGAPSVFELTFLTEGVRYVYGFAADGQVFLEEWLHAWPHGHKQTWLSREGDRFSFGDKLKGENRIIAGLTRPNALFLSAAAQMGHGQLGPVFRWITGIAVDGVSSRHGAPPSTRLRHLERWGPSRPLFVAEPTAEEADRAAFRAVLLGLLVAADIGIVDLRVVDDPAGPSRARVELCHQAGAGGAAWLPLEEESRGTQALFHLAGPMIEIVQRGGVLVVDELERSLHPTLALALVRLFNDPALNPRHAQLLFSTHDTRLIGATMGEPALRRDQVWLTEKDLQGATQLIPLTEYHPRKMENLERGYLQGRYGAVPVLGALLGAGALR
jgi:hypothetical protein